MGNQKITPRFATLSRLVSGCSFAKGHSNVALRLDFRSSDIPRAFDLDDQFRAGCFDHEVGFVRTFLTVNAKAIVDLKLGVRASNARSGMMV